MKIPYSRVQVLPDILAAARSGQIHTFSLHGDYISTWKHPGTDKATDDLAVLNNTGNAAASGTTDVETGSNVPDEPPAKRQRLEGGDVSSIDVTNSNSQGEVKSTEKPHQGKNRKNGKGGRRNAPSQAGKPERPTITYMTSTADGKYLVALSGIDKTIWVLKHNGQGHLEQISQRTMPKRPVSLFVGPDAQIISADKFGDVYAMPLIASSDPRQVSAVPAPSKAPFTPAASALTVHSKKNLESLKAQQKQAEIDRARRAQKGDDDTPSKPVFEHTLLLGHVSMLTGLALGQSDDGRGRNYIITCDRDEHIRVSRYAPQAYVIESFCLGHKEFLGAMVIPPTRRGVLVSGGGDPDIFVWNWQAGQLISTTGILSLVQEIAPEAAKVAVSGLFTLDYPSESGSLTYVLAIVEDVPAIFSWKLRDDNALKDPGVIQLPGHPLHLAVLPKTDQPPSIVVVIDPGMAVDVPSLNIYSLTMNEERLAVDTTSTVNNEPPPSNDLETTPEEIRCLFYGVEKLRKSNMESAEGDGIGAGEEATPGAAEVGGTDEDGVVR